ncbi:YaiI/YqxD family protein [Alteromonas sp. H39]|uniref:YaiI/YqxD family protein n=1 Tax=Alteromonas sp. H39 TaxID=3389876 RepID=UPI0039E00811
MQIWVDADSCPGVVKEILFKAARRTGLPLILVANHPMRVPPDKNITFMSVSSGFDVADDLIVERCEPGDLVITSDIPLASDLLAKGARALNSRGDEFDRSTIRAALTMRDFMETMRSSGERTGGPKAFSQKDKQNFANALDRILASA